MPTRLLSNFPGRPARLSAQRSLLGAGLLGVLAATAPAQRQFDELQRQNALPDHRDDTQSVAMGDVDGDGDLDLVIGNSGRHRLYFNDGASSGVYVDETVQRMPSVSGGVAVLGDVDGDGDLDVILGGRGQIGLLKNDGTGTFADVTSSGMPAGSGGRVALGDVDGDGDLDLAIGNDGSNNRLYLNDGKGTFSDATATRLPADADPTLCVALGDVDGDGDLDMVLGNGSPWVRGVANRLYLNDGTGRFTDGTTTRMPADADATVSVVLGDVDGDGDIDMVLGNTIESSYYYGSDDRLYLNDGAGRFTDATAGRLPGDSFLTASVALGDIDGDGDLDLVAAEAGLGFSTFGSEQNRLYLNDGAGGFTDASRVYLPPNGDPSSAVALGDVDGDGDLDMVFGNVTRMSVGANRLYLNDGRGRYADVTAPRMPPDDYDTAALALGDVDGDGDLDMFLGNRGPRSNWTNFYLGYQNQLLLNDGQGRYTDARVGWVGGGATECAAFGDVDGDGDLDLVTGNDRDNELYLNDGSGVFSLATTGLGSDWTRGVALGDVDGDGDLDLVCANQRESGGAQNRLYLNNGAGTFLDATARLPRYADASHAVVLGDFDGDGDLDLVFANTIWFSSSRAEAQDRLYLNDGTGTFVDVTATRMPVLTDNSEAVVAGDVDGDGDLDLVFGNSYPLGSEGRLCLNDGTGTFTDGTAGRLALGAGYGDCEHLALGDVDEDGDLDLVATGIGGDRLFLNDGLGSFTDATARMPAGYGAEVAMGDLDGDGDLDLAFASAAVRGPNRFYENLLRQLHAPLLLRTGKNYRLEVYARYGPPSSPVLAWPALSTRTASIQVPPFGTFGLDPAWTLWLPALIVPQPSGLVAFDLSVPNVAGLAGVAVHAQALVMPTAALNSSRLTHVVSGAVAR